MKNFYFFVFLILIVPFFTKAQFTGFTDESGMNVPAYSIDSSFIGNNSDVSQDSIDYSKGDSSFSQSNEVDINTVGFNRMCFVGEKNFNNYVDYFGCIIRVAILPFIFVLALMTFVWGVTVMMRHPDNQKSQEEGRTFILWGIIGFFVITSVYALVAIVRRTVGLGANFENDATPYVQLKEKVQKLK